MLKAELVSHACYFICILNPPEVVEAAGAVVRAYAMGDGCQRHIPFAECMPVIKPVLRNFVKYRGAMEHECGALWNMLGSGDAACIKVAAAVGLVDALQAVVDADDGRSAAGAFARGALAVLKG